MLTEVLSVVASLAALTLPRDLHLLLLSYLKAALYICQHQPGLCLICRSMLNVRSAFKKKEKRQKGESGEGPDGQTQFSASPEGLCVHLVKDRRVTVNSQHGLSEGKEGKVCP